mmetsp:Transcript_19301/g.27290  ORF Transcript_19301/g.27290 Transcript_19301/m.27290 type:complete len:540 (-) Transcript_19301:472-2091(-)
MAGAVLSNLFLFLLIFGLSATVDIKNLRKQLNNKVALATGVAMQFLIMPLLGYLAVIALKNNGLTQAMGITLLVVTASPGGSYSNWWCSTFNADLALSVAMTALSTILSIGLLPANLFLYSHLAYGLDGDSSSTDEAAGINSNTNLDTEGKDQVLQQDAGGAVIDSVDFGALFLSLGIVICAIVSGLYTSYFMHSHAFQRMANRGGTISGILLILFSVVLSSGSGGAESNFWSQPWPFYVGTGVPCILGLALANWLARTFRLTKPECIAISVECCYQNVGIATSVAITMFTDPTERAQAVSVPLFYGLVEAVVIGLYCVISWKRGWTKAPANEKFCIVVTNTYEIDNASHHRGDSINNLDVDSSMDEDIPPPGTVLNISSSSPRQHEHRRRLSSDNYSDNHVPSLLEAQQQQQQQQGGWLQRTFGRWGIFTRRNRHHSQSSALSIEGADNQKHVHDIEQPKHHQRCRIVSEDGTVATTGTDRSRLSCMGDESCDTNPSNNNSSNNSNFHDKNGTIGVAAQGGLGASSSMEAVIEEKSNE